ncbi:hypothetical protein FSBG_00092 [Fusobacterium gonidiaformans 3-1-5R]|uniref:Uncharacterized protein n=1 Tax=Fusobacterium gonidiaformans 3-1-5R TaxID=469605 RepID=E5BER4_9FUSO|nr:MULTISPECIES: hypothetical protein [Fusobacterium]EFS20595.1 hypothetical protein FSBG_00092 [Fusobacterium gonidiaformans 3-1-5R]KYM48162.1 hypothetical protein A2U04_05395 [Fusobacterium necrophorum subsp. funduliforme]
MINIEKYIHKTIGGNEYIQSFSDISSEIYKIFQDNMHFGIVDLEKIHNSLYDIYAVVEENKIKVISKESEEKISESIMEFVEDDLSKLTTTIFPTAFMLKLDETEPENLRIFFENLGTLNHYVGFWLLEQKVRN